MHYISSLSEMMERIDISSVNFGECENLLRQNYSFNNIEDLIMYKIEHYKDGFKIPILEYSLFLYQNDETIQLDLDLCNNISIIYYIPIDIKENEISQYNPESEIYNDGCNTYTSESGTDISLYDRKNNFNINIMSLCEKGCNFLRYEANNSKSNLGIVSCNILGFKDNIESNMGFYLLLLILAIFIIIAIIFCTKGYTLLKNKFDEVIIKDSKNKIKPRKIKAYWILYQEKRK